MPPIGLLTGGADFSDLFLVLHLPESVTKPAGGFATLQDATDAGAVTLNYGVFLSNCFSFFIVAIAMFAMVRLVNKLDAELDEAFGETPTENEPSDKKCSFCRTTIAYRAVRCPSCTSELTNDLAGDQSDPSVV